MHSPQDALRPSFGIHHTEPGGSIIGTALDDNRLLIDLRYFGDDKGSLRFLAQRADGLTEYDRPSMSNHYRLLPLPQTSRHTAPANGRHAYFAPQPESFARHPAFDERADDDSCGVIDESSLNANTTGGPPSDEFTSPSSVAGKPSTISPGTLEPDYLELSDNGTVSPSASHASTVGYAGHARDMGSNRDPTAAVFDSDEAVADAEVGVLKADNYRVTAALQRKVGAAGEAATPLVPTILDRSVSQPAYFLPQAKIISRNFGAAGPKQNSAPPAIGTVTSTKTGAPLVRRRAIRPKGGRPRPRSSSHPDSSLSLTRDSSTNDVFIPTTIPLEVCHKTTTPNNGNGSGSGGKAPPRPLPQLPQNLPARDLSSWDIRPQAEEVYEKLDQFFPDHDLDKPVIDTPSDGTAETPPIAPLIGGPGVRRYKKSIRVVAAERKKMLERIKAAKIQDDNATYLPDWNSVDTIIPVSNILRKRSTKMWGGRVEEFIGPYPNVPETIPEGERGRQRLTFKWVKGQLIGQGSYGRVYHAMNLTTGEIIAVKQVELHKVDSDRAASRQMLIMDALKSESDILQDLDHPHIVQYLGFEETMDVFSLFMEYVPGGSIGSVLRKIGKFEDEVVRSFSHQIIDGLAYLHKSGILHQDLKGDNILVDRSGICKITDFGISKRSESVYNNHEGTVMQGSIFWMAPEMLHNEQGYNAKIDIWSVGCVVLEMQAGRRPWMEDDKLAVMYKVCELRQAPPVPDDVALSPLADDFRRKCFAIDPAERPTAIELLAHPWLQVSSGWVFRGFERSWAPAATSAGTTGITTGAPLVMSTWTPQPDIQHRDIARPKKMSIDEMFEYLVHIGCLNFTKYINSDAYSRNCVATGGFGDIFKGRLHDGTPVAIKVWRSRALNEDLGKDGKRAMREIYNWSQLNHENIHKLLGVVLFDNRIGMVSKWMEEGNLREYLQRTPCVDRYLLCLQVAQGVEYLHSRNMIHGDLKAINILVSSDHKLKLTDFDYSIMVESTMFSQTTRIGEGTLRWMAPELVLVLDSEIIHQRNKRTDIYALGMTFLETITGALPYSECRADTGMFNVLANKQFPRRDLAFFASDQRGSNMWVLLMRCWDHDPNARPIAAEVTASLQTLLRETEPRNTV